MPTNRHSSNTRWSEPTWRDGYQLLAKSLEKKTQTLYIPVYHPKPIFNSKTLCTF